MSRFRARYYLQKLQTASPIAMVNIILRMCGVMNQEGRPWSLVIATYHFIMEQFVLITSCAQLYIEELTVEEKLECIALLTVYMHVTPKVVKTLFNQAALKNLLDKLEELRTKSLKEPESEHIITRTDKVCRRLIYIFYVCFSSITCYSIVFVTVANYFCKTDKPRLAFQLWLPFQYTTRTFVSSIFLMSGSIYFATFYVLLMVVTFQMTALLQVVKAKLESDQIDEREVYLLHRDIIKLVKDYNNLYSASLFEEIIVSTYQPCGYGYSFVKHLNRRDVKMFDDMYKFTITLIAPFIVCYCGEKINSELENIHSSAYMNQWYLRDKKSRSFLLTTMIATTKPITFSYRHNFTIFNFKSYTKVIQGVYSYMALIINLYGSA